MQNYTPESVLERIRTHSTLGDLYRRSKDVAQRDLPNVRHLDSRAWDKFVQTEVNGADMRLDLFSYYLREGEIAALIIGPDIISLTEAELKKVVPINSRKHEDKDLLRSLLEAKDEITSAYATFDPSIKQGNRSSAKAEMLAGYFLLSCYEMGSAIKDLSQKRGNPEAAANVSRFLTLGGERGWVGRTFSNYRGTQQLFGRTETIIRDVMGKPWNRKFV